MEFKKREIKTPRTVLKFEIELLDSIEDFELIETELTWFFNRGKEFHAFIVGLLRESGARLWELKKLEITSEEKAE